MLQQAVRHGGDAGSKRHAVCSLTMLGAYALIIVPAWAQSGKRTAGGPIDLFQQNKVEYAQPEEPAIVEVGKAQYLSLSGRGAPGGPEFAQSVGAMYTVAYGLKMKHMQTGRDYNVAPLEGLWWGNKDVYDFVNEPRETWNWKILIRTPDFVTEEQVVEAAKGATSRGQAAAGKIRLESLAEGKCVQMLHKGPYADEPASMAKMSEFAKSKGLVPNGYHHEIYLTDPNRTPPDKMRTILRQPVKEQ